MSEASFPEIAPLPAVMGMKDVCDLIGITSETARRLINDGALPGHRVPGGRQWVFRTEEVLTAISGWGAVGGDPSRTFDLPHPAGAYEDSASATGSTPDLIARAVAIGCAAPDRSPRQSDDSYLSECVTAWVAAAAERGVDAVPGDDNGVLIRDERIVLTVETQKVHIVDDFGDDRMDTIAIVVAGPR